jgi:hypothetical protein
MEIVKADVSPLDEHCYGLMRWKRQYGHAPSERFLVGANA